MTIKWPYRYFTPRELLSRDGLFLFEGNQLMICPYFVTQLDEFRAYLNKPILVNHRGMTNRGYRSPDENEAVGGAKFSRHVQGLAADITVPGMEPEEVGMKALDFGFKFTKIYPTWTHVDMRY